MAEIYAATGHRDWAEAELAKAPAPPPCSQQPLACSFESGMHDAILRATVESGTAESLYWRALAFSGKARDAHDHLLALPPSSASHRLLASVDDLSGRPRDAAAAWRKAVDLDPADLSLRRNLLRSLRSAGLHEESLREAGALLKLRPESAAGRFHWELYI